MKLGQELVQIEPQSNEQHHITGTQDQVIRDRQEKRPTKRRRDTSRAGHGEFTQRSAGNRGAAGYPDALEPRIAQCQVTLDGEQLFMRHFTF
jgi:hypothetical protein